MVNYYVKRLGQAVFSFWATITATFALIKWMPGGPMDWIMQRMMGASATSTRGDLQPSARAEFDDLVQTYTSLDPSKPLHHQYVDYMGDVLQGDFGKSLAIFLSFITRVVVGAALAYKEGSNFDLYGTTALIWGHSVPYFLVAIWLVYVFSYQLEWFPRAGKLNWFVEPGLNYPFVAGLMHHAALPVLSLAWAEFGAGAIAMRANSIQVLGEDYLRVARLRGLRTKRLALRYVARNAILPMYTGLVISIGYIFGGAIILETIFKYRGVGFYMWKGIQARDYPVLMGGFILITASVVTALLVADLTYSWVDPRIQTGDKDNAF